MQIAQVPTRGNRKSLGDLGAQFFSGKIHLDQRLFDRIPRLRYR
jgi:hypothetical protein